MANLANQIRFNKASSDGEEASSIVDAHILPWSALATNSVNVVHVDWDKLDGTVISENDKFDIIIGSDICCQLADCHRRNRRILRLVR